MTKWSEHRQIFLWNKKTAFFFACGNIVRKTFPVITMGILFLLTSLGHQLRAKIRPEIFRFNGRRGGPWLNLYSLVILNLLFQTGGQPNVGQHQEHQNATQRPRTALVPFHLSRPLALHSVTGLDTTGKGSYLAIQADD